MNDQLFDFFHQELSYLREESGKFSERYPLSAQNLKLSTQGSQEPQIAMLMEAFAFLNARIRKKLEDQYPELTQTLLNLLYPHYQCPIPAMGILQFLPAFDLRAPFKIPAKVQLATESSIAEHCYFQTCYDTELLPLTVTQVEISEPGQFVQNSPLQKSASSCLKLKLSCLDPSLHLSQLNPQKIRFFLKAKSRQAFFLYETLFKKTQAIAIREGNHTALQWIDIKSMQKVGFAENEGLLPYDSRSALAYRLLTEHFIFPEKFLFFDLHLSEYAWPEAPEAELIFFIDTHDLAFELEINPDLFALNCTPIVNLFSRSAEPVQYSIKQHECPVIIDTRRPNYFEIYSVDKVQHVNDQGGISDLPPVHGFTATGEQPAMSWMTMRRYHQETDQKEIASQLYLSLFKLSEQEVFLENQTLHLETTCMNRHLPSELSYSSSTNLLRFTSFSAPIEGCKLLVSPSKPQPPLAYAQPDAALIAHLGSHYSSLTDNQHGLEDLRQLLKLYSSSHRRAAEKIAASLQQLQTERVLKRINIGLASLFCQGLKLTLVLDDACFIETSAYLFAEVLECFFQRYCSLNSFVELTVLNLQGETVYQGHTQPGQKQGL